MNGDTFKRRWLVIFGEPLRCPREADLVSRAGYALLRFLKPGFRHVWAMTPAETFQGWLEVNPTMGGLVIREHAGDGEFQRILGRAQVGLVSLVEAEGKVEMQWRPRGPVTCVSVVKHMLGVRGWCLTPAQLHKKLTGD